MYFRDIIQLVQQSTTSTTNDYGDFVRTTTLKTVYGDKLDVTQTEKYQALAHGKKPDFKFKMRLIDYSNETQFKYNNRIYNIVRTYSPDGEMVELVGEGIVSAERRST